MSKRLFSTNDGISNVLAKDLKICPMCDAPLTEGQKFCSRCGTQLDKDTRNLKIKTRVLRRVVERKTHDKESRSDVIERLLDETEGK